jgi:hypothetical protein
VYEKYALACSYDLEGSMLKDSIVQSKAVQNSGERYPPKPSYWHELCGYKYMVASKMGRTAYDTYGIAAS